MNRVPLWLEVEGTDEWTLASNLKGGGGSADVCSVCSAESARLPNKSVSFPRKNIPPQPNLRRGTQYNGRIECQSSARLD
jgi:hypothetical protein